MLFARGRLRDPAPPEAAIGAILDATGAGILELTPAVAALAVRFPHTFPADPADRLIAATACTNAIPLVTADERIRESPMVRTIW